MDKRSKVRIKPNVVKIYYYLHKFTIRCTSKNIAMIVWLHHTSIVWNWKHLIIIIKISDCHKIKGSVKKLSIWLFKITYWSQYVIFPVFCPYLIRKWYSSIVLSRSFVTREIFFGSVLVFTLSISLFPVNNICSWWQAFSKVGPTYCHLFFISCTLWIFGFFSLKCIHILLLLRMSFKHFFFLFYRPCTVMLHVLDTKSSSDLTFIESAPPPLGLMYLIHYVHYRWYIWKAIVIAWG